MRSQDAEQRGPVADGTAPCSLLSHREHPRGTRRSERRREAVPSLSPGSLCALSEAETVTALSPDEDETF